VLVRVFDLATKNKLAYPAALRLVASGEVRMVDGRAVGGPDGDAGARLVSPHVSGEG
jgi:hypothetical protein